MEQSEDRKLFGLSAGLRDFPKETIETILVASRPFHKTTTSESFRTPSQQTSAVLHEVCHYVRPPAEGGNNVLDFAYGLPGFRGQPGTGSESGHNY